MIEIEHSGDRGAIFLNKGNWHLFSFLGAKVIAFKHVSIGKSAP